jgi:hypothetical protein
MRKMLTVMGVDEGVPRILRDSQSALALVRKPVVPQRSKHIDVLHHFVRERSEREEIGSEYWSAKHTVADSLTEVVRLNTFVLCRTRIGVTLCETSLSGSVDRQSSHTCCLCV